MSGVLATLLAELKEDETLAEVRKALEDSTDPLELVEGLRKGMSIVGKRFENKEYYLSELIMSAEIFKEAIALIEPHLDKEAGPSRGRVVIGTVKGDIHDIGKNIVATLLGCEGYDVHDVGVDIQPDAFIDKLKETGAFVLALSGLLTLAFDSMKETVESLTEAGLRDKVKVIIGGGPVNDKVVEYTGADAFGMDATPMRSNWSTNIRACKARQPTHSRKWGEEILPDTGTYKPKMHERSAVYNGCT